MNATTNTDLPFNTHSGQPQSFVQIPMGEDREFLLDTAFHAYSECWKVEATHYIQDNPEFLQRHSLVLPQSAEGDEDFDAWDILMMQIQTRLDVLMEMKAALIAEGYGDAIVSKVLQHPVMQARVRNGEMTLVEAQPQEELIAA